MLPSNGVGLQEMLSPGWIPKVTDVFSLVVLVTKGAAASKLPGRSQLPGSLLQWRKKRQIQISSLSCKRWSTQC